MLELDSPPQQGQFAAAEWKAIVARFQRSSTWRALWQLSNTLVPYAVLWWLMYVSLGISYWLTLPLVLLSGGLLIRVFIIFHDCGHGSFFPSRTANRVVGFFTGMLCFTPFSHWRWEHARHHATTGDLDRRGIGDIWTMTVAEYMAAPRWKRLAYRLARSPFVLFLLAPLFLFVVRQRFPSSKASRRDRRSVWHMNIAILAMAVVLSAIYGIIPYIIIQSSLIMIAGAAGIWLFYVQHQFEDAYWERRESWDYTAAALEGSSFYKLPRILQWFTGNIGYHHVHHLSCRIPNYYLERCHKSHPLFQSVKPLTLLTSLRSLTFRLWDERLRRLVGFGHVRRLRRKRRRRIARQQAAASLTGARP